VMTSKISAFSDAILCISINLLIHSLNLAGYLLGLLFDLEDGGSMSYQNIIELVPIYTMSHPRR
jgi:hypothetical protein